MSQEFLPHLFEAFSQEESTEVANPNGTGLGLAIAKKYMDMMGGSIQVRSKLNHGTTFELHLMVEETEEKASSHSSGGNHCHFGNLHILLAEDNALNQEIAQMLLTTKGLGWILSLMVRRQWISLRPPSRNLSADIDGYSDACYEWLYCSRKNPPQPAS